MLTLRIFIASPGDVAEERRLAIETIHELESSHLLRAQVALKVVAWDDPAARAPLDGRETPQQSVLRFAGRPADCDLTLAILWSRLGTPLPAGMRRADGTGFASGTVWEVQDALDADRPVFVYRRTERPRIELDDPAFDSKRAQFEALNRWFTDFERNADGSLRRGINDYATPSDLRALLRQHLEAFVAPHLKQASVGSATPTVAASPASGRAAAPAPTPTPTALASPPPPAAVHAVPADHLVVRRLGASLQFEFTPAEPGARPLSMSRTCQDAAILPLVRSLTLGHSSANTDERRTLFQLLVPNELKPALRHTRALCLDVDLDTGSWPWELLQTTGADSGGPLGVQAAIVRRLGGRGHGSAKALPVGARALVVANPSTAGFADAFPGSLGVPLPDLPCAEREGDRVAQQLQVGGLDVRLLPPGASAQQVLTALHSQPWHVVHVAGHGVLDLKHADGLARSGVVLSGGALLTGAEFGALESTPLLVVLTCEHFGRLRKPDPAQALAACITPQLLDIGVRCLIAPAWSVSDEAAMLFSDAFYGSLLAGGTFAQSVHAARQALWRRDPHDFTGASLQAWGDPDWVARQP
jgi:hypothetical protein